MTGYKYVIISSTKCGGISISIPIIKDVRFLYKVLFNNYKINKESN
jgi:hypothetical protein